MIITRVINGETHTFELTQREREQAFFEQQFDFDRQDVLNLIDDMDDNAVLDSYGVTREEYISMADDIAVTMRRNIDKYDMDWVYAREDAVRTVIGTVDA